MKVLLRKEIRQLLPIWIVALVLAAVPVWVIPLQIGHDDTAQALSFAILCFGGLLLAMTPFGQEFNAGTFSQLLSQPVPRRELWRVKTGVLGAAALSLFLVFFVSYRMRILGTPELEGLVNHYMVNCGFMILTLFTGGLWTTLLLRQTAAAFWITVLIPAALCCAVGVLLIYGFHIKEPLPEWLFYSLLVVYSAAGFLAARRMFLRAQDVQWTGGTLSLPMWMTFRRRTKVSVTGQRRTPLRALLRKEFEFQHASLLIAAVLLVLHIVIVVVRKMSPGLVEPSNSTAVVFAMWFILWFALPFLIGSVSVAEERKLGTMESHLCLPVSRRIQFAVKFGIAILLSVLICAVLPWLIEGTGILSGVRGSPFDVFFAPKDLKVLSAFAAGIAALSFYASTLTRNTLQAIGAAVVVNILAATVIVWTMVPENLFVPGFSGAGLLFRYIGAPGLVLALLWLAARNYRFVFVDKTIWLRNIVAVLIVFLASATATALIYTRSWEMLMTVEPAHGPATLSGPIRPKVCEIYGERLFVLLPDGKLWRSTDSERRFLCKYEDRGEVKDAYTHVPLKGEFVGDSDWTSLAGDFLTVIGLQRDGSLWRFTLVNRTNFMIPPRLERIGTDSDWKAIAASREAYLALKTNGTLWGWGNNFDGRLGPGPDSFTNGLVQIGTDSNWDSVSISDQVSIGVKLDGSVWKWGRLYRGPDGVQFLSEQKRIHREPVKWDLNGSDWIAREGNGVDDLVLRRDGTLWSPWLPNNSFGQNFGRESFQGLTRVGNEADWAAIELSGDHLVGIKRNGALIENNNIYASRLRKAFYRRPSGYSDWIAATPVWQETTLALAADGTLCCWFRPLRESPDGPQLLGPSRRPFWSLNILTSTK